MEIEKSTSSIAPEHFETATSDFLKGKSRDQVKDYLLSKGLDDMQCTQVMTYAWQQAQLNVVEAQARKEGKMDMIYGSLWCIGGTVLTIADVGYIFWGAIIFGAIQFFKGLYNFTRDF